MQNVSKITFVILGAIIGAGFISGQEIYIFFNKFGINGIFGILISGVIIGITIKKTCKIIKENNINTYEEFIEYVIPIKSKYLKLILNNIINIFLLISFFIMCTAFNSYFKQEFKIPIYISGVINGILCLGVFLKSSKIIIKANQILIPIILIAIVFLFFKNTTINYFEKIYFNIEILFALLSGIIYASYNTILLIPILITLKNYFTNNKQIKTISLISCIVIICLSIIIYILNSLLINVKNVEIPLIYIADSQGIGYYYIYSFIILIAIFTSEISVGYGFLKNTFKKEKTYRKIGFLITLISIPISYIGFSNLVSLLYPIFGVLGIIQIFFIVKY